MTNPETYNRIVTVGVDIQKDFCPGGALGVTDGDRIIEPFNQVAAWTRAQNGQVVLTRDMHPQQTGHFNIWPVHCVRGTEGAEFHEGLVIEKYDRVLDKGTAPDEDAYSGFDGADTNGVTLERMIAPRDDERIALLIGGLATDYCVKATVLDACELADKRRPYPQLLDVYVLQDTIKAVNLQPQDEQRAIDEMKIRGAKFVTSRQVLDGMIEVKEQ